MVFEVKERERTGGRKAGSRKVTEGETDTKKKHRRHQRECLVHAQQMFVGRNGRKEEINFIIPPRLGIYFRQARWLFSP